MRYSSGLKKEELYEELFDYLDSQLGDGEQNTDVVSWAEGLLLDGRPFSLREHQYQLDMLTKNAPRQVFLKGAQIGATSIIMLKTLHGLITGRYPQGALYLFPSRGDVMDFSRGRFAPLINDNEDVARFIKDTDSMGIKRVGRSVLYLRGARSTQKIAGMKRTSSQLKSVPVDRLCFDECDEMEPAMIDLAVERLSHSTVKEEIYLSTPSVPDWGVDALFSKSDQRHWHIPCSKCKGETVLELTFPDCLHERPDGTVIRLCQRCKDSEIHPRDGHWVPLYPDRAKDLVGWRISQLNSMFVDPAKILKLYYDPPGGNLTEVYNSKLAQAHIEAENRLTVPQVLALCGDKPRAQSDPGPCFLGADIGRQIHVVIGKRHWGRKGEIVYIGAVPDWHHLDDLMERFHVARAVIDALPEQRLSREFAQAHPGRVFCCFYQEGKVGYSWNEKDMTLKVNRTEALDASHNQLVKEEVVLPRQSETLEEFARHCSNVVRVLQTDPETGTSKYIYLKTGEDHFRHAHSYEAMARGFGTESAFADVDLS